MPEIEYALTPGTLIRRFHAHDAHDMIRVVEASKADYLRLARLHYRAKSPATIDRVLGAQDQATGEIVAVLVTSRPTLNAAWRKIAWPGRFDVGTKSERARKLNYELRTISRVIVDPRYRGRGLAKSLVAAYLKDPTTHLTEAVAAMGSICPFFERAGMRRLDLPMSVRDSRLQGALRAHSASVLELLTRADLMHELETELRAWAQKSASTRAIARSELRVIAREAAARLLAPPSVYVHDTAQSVT